MGKISKALKKAEKQFTVNPSQHLKEKIEPTTIESQVPSHLEEREHTPETVPQKAEPVESLTNIPMVEPHGEYETSSVMNGDQPPVSEQVPVRHVEKIPNHRPDPLPIEQTVADVKRQTIQDPGNSRNNNNIALLNPAASEFAQKARQPSSQLAVSEQRDVESRSNQNNKLKKRMPISYSKTNVQANDPKKLKENKVLSIFEDMETTNQFKILRTQVLRKLKEINGNSIMVTSSNPCEGKTFTSINLGVSIAKEFDRTVLIIDADIRRPLKGHTDFATEFFSLKVDRGLTDYLQGDADIEEILINPGIDKLTLIPGGVPVDNSPELLNSERMEQMMEELKSRYSSERLIILDGPAILHYPDAMIMYQYVDGVLPVVESERTSTEEVKKMMDYLHEVNILGVVMNKKRG